MRRVFLDTNVVVDLLAKREGFFEDALQYHSALTSNVEIIITRNVKDFTASKLPVVTPHEFLEA